MMTINFDTITNNYEVIYVIKTVMKYHLKKIDASFHQPLPKLCPAFRNTDQDGRHSRT
jgi:elongation factor P--beta-lysine ligase